MTPTKHPFYDTAFFQHQSQTAMDAAAVIVPYLHKIFEPISVIDLGCAGGEFMDAFTYIDNQLYTTGIDGPWSPRPDSTKHDFIEWDIEKTQAFPEVESADLVLCLEVAEHLTRGLADKLVQWLCSIGGVVIFSAAVPGQTGADHINCAWPSFWDLLFRLNGYACWDVLRPQFWDNEAVPSWYSQNIFAYVPSSSLPHWQRDGYPEFPVRLNGCPQALIHPGQYYELLPRTLKTPRILY